MANSNNLRLKFGGKKYSAFNLIIARWIRNFALAGHAYNYITLGGTELYDVANLGWIDKVLVSNVRSYEDDEKRFRLAENAAKIMRAKGINIELRKSDFFSYDRDLDGRHIFFLDLQGMCSPGQYIPLFREWFSKEVFQPGDVMLITSYMGRNPGWPRVLDRFEGDFLSLGVHSLPEKKKTYEFAHPLLVMYRALRRADLSSELNLRCFGYIRYRDDSPMGLYGITCEEGQTQLKSLVTNIPWFNSIKREWQINNS